MSYHNWTSIDFTPSMTYLSSTRNYDNYGQLPGNSTFEVPVNDRQYRSHLAPTQIQQVDRRTGTNRSQPSASNVRYVDKTVLVNRKVKVGHKVVRQPKWVRVKDKKTGLMVYERKMISFHQTVDLKIPKIVKVRVKVKDVSNTLLAPNALDFQQTLKLVSPSEAVYEVTNERDATFSRYGMTDVYRVNSTYGGTSTNMTTLFPWWEKLLVSNLIPDSYADDSRALSKLYKKVSSEFPQYLVSLGEAGESYRTLSQIFKVSVEFAMALKKLDLARIAKRIKGITPSDISKLYLTYMFGIRPIVQDISDTINLASRESRTWRTYTASDTVFQDYTSENFWPSTAYGYNYNSRHATVIEKRARKHSIKYGVIMSGDQSFSRWEERQRPIESQIATIYELVPFSFMVDWIYDIGSFLASQRVFDNGLMYAWKTTTSVDAHLISVHYHNQSGPPMYLRVKGPDQNFAGTNVSCTRLVLTELPAMPTPKFTSWQKASSITHLSEIAALFLTGGRR